MGVVLKDILAVLPNGNEPEVKKTSIFIEGDRITGIGTEPSGFKADEIIDGKDKLVIPGLINCHTHTYMAFMRNIADDLPFMEWLFGRIDPIEQKMSDEDVYWGACLGIIEMMKTGTTCFSDMQMNPGVTSKAAIESGMRAVISRGLVGNGNDEGGRKRINDTYKDMELSKDCDRISFMFGPHAPYTCDEEYMRIVSDEAKKSGLGIHVHLSESVSEIEQIREKYGCSPIEMAERNGLFDVRCVAAHCVQIDDKDIDIMAKHNVSVVTNPASNMKLGNGFAPVPEMIEKGINVCLGTDGAASNNSLNLFKELHLLTMIHKGTHRNPECISAKEGFNIATINGAKALGLEKEIGSIEVGKKADLAILSLKNPSMQPVNNIIAGLSYSADGTEVETVFINGVKTVDNKKVLTLDEDLVYEKVNEIIKRLTIDIK